MKDAPAYDWYPERFWFAVEGWTDREIVAYKRLLDQQWQRDGLPDDMRALSGLARGKVPECVLAKFPVSSDGLRRNPFLESIRKSQRERIAKRREGAAITNAKRHAQRTQSDTLNGRSATRYRPNVDIASESPPPTTHHPPRTHTPNPSPPPAVVGECPAVAGPHAKAIEEIVSLYPLNGNKYEAMTALLAAVEDGNDIGFIRECVKIHADYFGKLPPHRQSFCPSVHAYFSKRRWTDNPSLRPWTHSEEPEKKKKY